eukprot:5582017-Amphidinium_carterae.1
MRSHLTAQQAADADLPAGYKAGNAEANLLARNAVQEVPELPPLLSLFRQAAAAARTFGVFSRIFCLRTGILIPFPKRTHKSRQQRLRMACRHCKHLGTLRKQPC